jgi:phage shock protein PspC (stress-responsive transcriptional regulator)
MDPGAAQAHAASMNATDDSTSTPPPFSAPPPPPPPPPPPARLTRATDDKIVSGLCGGLGRHFGLDPIVFRIAFVVLALAGGSGLLLYLLGWALIPDDRTGATLLHHARHGRSSEVVAAVLLGIGGLLLLSRLGEHGGSGIPAGLVLVGVGAAVLWSRRDRGDRTPPAAPPPGPGTAPPPGPGGTWPPTPPGPPAWEQAPADPSAPPAGAPPPTPPAFPPPPSALPAAGAAARPRSVLVPVTLSLLAVLAGGLALLATTGAASVPASVGVALALVLVGAAMVVGAWRGRARGLVPVALVLGAALAATSIADVPIRGDVGDRSWRPLTPGDLRSPYRLGAGDMVVDLGAIDLSGGTATVVASVGAGDLEVVVPEGAAVDVDGHAGAGDVSVLGRTSEGLGARRHVVEPGREGGGRLVLRVRVGFGDLEVHRASA